MAVESSSLFSAFSKKIRYCPPNIRPSCVRMRCLKPEDARTFWYDTDVKGNKVVGTAEKFLDLDHPLVSSTHRKWQVIFRVLQVPVVIMSWNLACILIKAIETHSDLNFVESSVSTYENLPRKMRFSGSYLTTFLLVCSYTYIYVYVYNPTYDEQLIG